MSETEMAKNKINVIIIPGNGGATMNDHWIPYVVKELTKLGLDVRAKNFPDPFLARKKYWLPFIKDVLKADENSILIGHSSGAEAAMRFAEEHKVLGSILVSACYTDLGIESETISGWYDDPWLWEKIKKNQKWIVQFASVDDRIIPIEEHRYVHKKLDSKYIEFTDRGHFTRRQEFPEIVEVIKNKLQ